MAPLWLPPDLILDQDALTRLYDFHSPPDLDTSAFSGCVRKLDRCDLQELLEPWLESLPGPSTLVKAHSIFLNESDVKDIWSELAKKDGWEWDRFSEHVNYMSSEEFLASLAGIVKVKARGHLRRKSLLVVNSRLAADDIDVALLNSANAFAEKPGFLSSLTYIQHLFSPSPITSKRVTESTGLPSPIASPSPTEFISIQQSSEPVEPVSPNPPPPSSPIARAMHKRKLEEFVGSGIDVGMTERSQKEAKSNERRTSGESISSNTVRIKNQRRKARRKRAKERRALAKHGLESKPDEGIQLRVVDQERNSSKKDDAPPNIESIPNTRDCSPLALDGSVDIYALPTSEASESDVKKTDPTSHEILNEKKQESKEKQRRKEDKRKRKRKREVTPEAARNDKAFLSKEGRRAKKKRRRAHEVLSINAQASNDKTQTYGSQSSADDDSLISAEADSKLTSAINPRTLREKPGSRGSSSCQSPTPPPRSTSPELGDISLISPEIVRAACPKARVIAVTDEDDDLDEVPESEYGNWKEEFHRRNSSIKVLTPPKDADSEAEKQESGIEDEEDLRAEGQSLCTNDQDALNAQLRPSDNVEKERATRQASPGGFSQSKDLSDHVTDIEDRSKPKKSKKRKKELELPKTPRKKQKTTGQTSQYFDSPSPRKPRTPKGTSIIEAPPLTDPKFGLIQEEFAHDPFKLLVAVIFLNKTRGKYAIPVFRSFIELHPTPEVIANLDMDTLVSVFQNLGLQNQRAKTLFNLAHMWLSDPPARDRRHRTLNYPLAGDSKGIKPGEILSDDDPRPGAFETGHLFGLGQYAWDSWRIFCRDELRGVAKSWNGKGADDLDFEPEWKRVIPKDKELRAILKWMWLKERWVWDPFTGERKMLESSEVEL